MSGPSRISGSFLGIRKGPLLMILASLAFTIMVSAVKYLRAQDMPALEIVLWRAVLAVPLLGLLASRVGFTLVNRRAFIVRLLLGFVAMTCFFTATKGMGLTDLTLLHKIQPVLIVLIAPLIMGQAEKVSGVLWIPLLLGLFGSVILLAPSMAFEASYATLAIVATIASTGAHLSLRVLGQTDNARAVVFWFQAGTAVLAFLLVMGTNQSIPLPPIDAWLPLLIAGLGAVAGQLLVTRAYAVEQAGPVAAASYVGPIWSLFADLFLFGLTPSTWALVGGAMVLVSGLWIVRGVGTPIRVRPRTSA